MKLFVKTKVRKQREYLKNIIYKIRTNVPPIISKAPIAALVVKGSPKNITANIIDIATLILSTGATCDTFPNCKALK